MNLLIIANNVEGNIDGIGKHARMLSDEFKRGGHSVVLLSAKSGFNKWASFFTPAMCIVFCKAIWNIISCNIDYVIVEYPFKEHNPFILFFHIILYVQTRFCHTKIAFSMHEYNRVNFLRKRVIDIFLIFCDVVFVSEKKYIRQFHRISYKISLRNIPNHIQCNHPGKSFMPNTFCYFGLVNSSKAFSEMLEAWRLFNKDRNSFLHIISSTNLHEWKLDSYDGVIYHFNLSPEDVSQIMYNCSFCIVPVKPEIGLNNSSFVSAIQCGCIPIGHFSKELINESFIINVEDYSIRNMHKAFITASEIEEKQYEIMSEKARMFGKDFSLEKTAKQMICALEEYRKIH